MTEKEYKLTCEVEKLKKELKEKNNKIKDLEIEKKTLKWQLKNKTELLEDISKENKTKECKELKRKYSIAEDEINKLRKEIDNKDSIIQALKARLNKKRVVANGFKSKMVYWTIPVAPSLKSVKYAMSVLNQKRTTRRPQKPIRVSTS